MTEQRNLKTPVAFLVFNRPATTQIVFKEIAKAKPAKLLIIADGPRANKSGEKERCRQTRSIIEKIDWDCDVLTNFSQANMGCKKRVSSGLDWVFEQVEEAIILEDDCVPHPNFFQFCEEMLERYRHNETISLIGGSNFLLNKYDVQDSYYFSKLQLIWGWATWRRAWRFYDVTMKMWETHRNSGLLNNHFENPAMGAYYAKFFDKVLQGDIDTWDYQWQFTNILNGRLSIVPQHNLVSNIGFGLDATHTKFVHPVSNLPTASIKFPLTHPQRIAANSTYDNYVFNQYFNIGKIKRVLYKIKSLISR